MPAHIAGSFPQTAEPMTWICAIVIGIIGSNTFLLTFYNMDHDALSPIMLLRQPMMMIILRNKYGSGMLDVDGGRVEYRRMLLGKYCGRRVASHLANVPVGLW